MNPNKIAQNLAIKIRPVQIKIEIVLVSLILIGILIRSSEIGNMLIVFSFNLLSILYFIMVFRLSAPENKTVVFLNKLIQLSFTVGMIGILFAIQHYPGGAMMLRLAIIAMFIGLIFTFITKLKNKELQNFIDADIIRIVIFTLVITGLISFGGFDITNYQDNLNNQEINIEVKKDSSNID